MNYQGETGTISYHKAMTSARGNLMNMLRRSVLVIPDLAMKNEGGKLQIHFHAFRKWFKTQVTNAQESDFAEALMGHKSLKLVYYKQSAEERQKMYKKLEPNLTISDFSKVEKTMEEMQSQIESLTIELEKVKQWKEITAKYKHHQDQLAYTRLYAPFSGYVQKRLFEAHETIGAGMPVISSQNKARESYKRLALAVKWFIIG